MISCRRLAKGFLFCLMALPLLGAPELMAQDSGQAPPYPESPLNLPPKPAPLRRTVPAGSEPLTEGHSAPAPKAVKVKKARKARPAPAPVAAPRPKASKSAKAAQPAKPAKAAKAKKPPVVTPPAAARPAVKAKPSTPLNRTLAIQEALNRAGYAAPRDGQMNKATKSALRRFQHAHGLKVTGTPNRQTMQKLGLH